MEEDPQARVELSPQLLTCPTPDTAGTPRDPRCGRPAGEASRHRRNGEKHGLGQRSPHVPPTGPAWACRGWAGRTQAHGDSEEGAQGACGPSSRPHAASVGGYAPRGEHGNPTRRPALDEGPHPVPWPPAHLRSGGFTSLGLCVPFCKTGNRDGDTPRGPCGLPKVTQCSARAPGVVRQSGRAVATPECGRATAARPRGVGPRRPLTQSAQSRGRA